MCLNTDRACGRLVARKGRNSAPDGSVSDNGRMDLMVHLHVATLASALSKFAKFS